MNRLAGFSGWIAIGCVAGFGGAELALRSVSLHETVGKYFDRGDLLALVNGHGIYQIDLDRRLDAARFLTDSEDEEPTTAERKAALDELVANTAAESRSSFERFSQSELTRQANLLRFQFADEKIWRAALNRSGLSPSSVARMLKQNLKTREWLEKRIASEISVTEEECRQFYDSHRGQFFLPEQRDVAHLFLAAPPETPVDVVKAKRGAVGVLSAQLFVAPQEFAVLATQNSEDDATKFQGGELGFLSAERMPPDFIEAATKLRSGEISDPIRTRLGFHILQLLDVQPARYQTFDEVRQDVAIELANQKRAGAVPKLIHDFCRGAYLRQL